MTRYVKETEKKFQQLLEKDQLSSWEYEEVKERMRWLAHERLCHLLVMLATLIVCALFFVVYLLLNQWLLGLAAILLLIMSVFYIKHYFFLEYHMQKWYEIADDLKKLVVHDKKSP